MVWAAINIFKMSIIYNCNFEGIFFSKKPNTKFNFEIYNLYAKGQKTMFKHIAHLHTDVEVSYIYSRDQNMLSYDVEL